MTINPDRNYQTDMHAGSAQVFQFSTPTFRSWVAKSDMTNGDFTMPHKGPDPGAKTEAVIYPDFPKQKDMDIVIGVEFSDYTIAADTTKTTIIEVSTG